MNKEKIKIVGAKLDEQISKQARTESVIESVSASIKSDVSAAVLKHLEDADMLRKFGDVQGLLSRIHESVDQALAEIVVDLPGRVGAKAHTPDTAAAMLRKTRVSITAMLAKQWTAMTDMAAKSAERKHKEAAAGIGRK